MKEFELKCYISFVKTTLKLLINKLPVINEKLEDGQKDKLKYTSYLISISDSEHSPSFTAA